MMRLSRRTRPGKKLQIEVVQGVAEVGREVGAEVDSEAVDGEVVAVVAEGVFRLVDGMAYLQTLKVKTLRAKMGSLTRERKDVLAHIGVTSVIRRYG